MQSILAIDKSRRLGKLRRGRSVLVAPKDANAIIVGIICPSREETAARVTDRSSRGKIARYEITGRLFSVDPNSSAEKERNRHKLRLLVSNEGVLPTYLPTTAGELREREREREFCRSPGRQKRRFFASLRSVSTVFTIPFHLTVPMAISAGKKGLRPLAEKRNPRSPPPVSVSFPFRFSIWMMDDRSSIVRRRLAAHRY